jgi:hypothetical protein
MIPVYCFFATASLVKLFFINYMTSMDFARAVGCLILYLPLFFPLAIPSSCRSLRRLVSNSENTPSISKKALPAALDVTIGCSIAF